MAARPNGKGGCRDLMTLVTWTIDAAAMFTRANETDYVTLTGFPKAFKRRIRLPRTAPNGASVALSPPTQHTLADVMHLIWYLNVNHPWASSAMYPPSIFSVLTTLRLS